MPHCPPPDLQTCRSPAAAAEAQGFVQASETFPLWFQPPFSPASFEGPTVQSSVWRTAVQLSALLVAVHNLAAP